MLILQIIAIPIVLFFLLSVVFIVGSLGTEIAGHPAPGVQQSQKTYDATKAQAEESDFSGIPFVRI